MSLRPDRARTLTRRRARDVVLVAVAVLGLVASLALLAQVHPNEPPTSELLVPAAYLEPWQRVRALFGPTAEYELVLVSSRSPLSDARLGEIEGTIRGVPGVTRTWSSLSRPRLLMTEGDAPTFAVAQGPPPLSAPQAIDRFLRPSPDEAGIWVVLDERARALTGARQFERDLHAALDAIHQEGETLRDVGTPARRVASWETAAHDGRRALPWLVTAVVLVPLLFFRSPVAVLFPLLIAGLTSGTLFVAYRVVNGRLDTWMLVLFPFVWSVATMDALHLYEGSSHGAGHEDAVARTRGEVALPALVTAGTTALSMLTLAFPGAPPLLKTFGLWGALGTMLAYGYTFTLGGALLRVFRPSPVPPWSSRFTRRAVALSRRRPGRVLAAWALVCAAACAGVTRLRVEPNYQHTFAPGNPAGDAIRALQRSVDAELVPFEIYLEARTPRQRHPNELLLASLALQDYLATLPETRLSLSAATLLSEWVQTDPRAHRILADPRFSEHLRERVGPLAADPQISEWLRLDRGVTRTEVLFRPLTYARKGGARPLDHALRRDQHDRLPRDLRRRELPRARDGARGAPVDRLGRGDRPGPSDAAHGRPPPPRAPRLGRPRRQRRPRPRAVRAHGARRDPVVVRSPGPPRHRPGARHRRHRPSPLADAARAGGYGGAFQRSMRTYGVAVAATCALLSTSLAGLSLSGFGVNHELGLLLPAGLLLGLAAELTLVPAALAIRPVSRSRT